MQRKVGIDFKWLFILWLSIFWQPFPAAVAQTAPEQPVNDSLSCSFRKPDITIQSGQLCFNIVSILNKTGSPVRIKPYFVLPDGWSNFSPGLPDTIVPAGDSLLLPLRFRVPTDVNSETAYEVFFRGYSMRNELLSECVSVIHPEPFHKWELSLSNYRTFFFPGSDQASFNVLISNQGNATESLTVTVNPDMRSRLPGNLEWQAGRIITLAPFQDTVIPFDVVYNSAEDRIFDMSRVNIAAYDSTKKMVRSVMIEKYNSIYAPLFIDYNLPHQAEIGFRTFSNNQQILPFIKARGMTSFKNHSRFSYNFNYYALTGNEDLLGNTYYNFLYEWNSLKVGLGAFSSQYGRNLYTRNGIMLANRVRLSPNISLEAFVSQSIFTPKTSAAVGYEFKVRKIEFNGSMAFDRDAEMKMNTTSLMFQSGVIPLLKNHSVSFNMAGYREYHYRNSEYTLEGITWDLRYFGKFGELFALQLSNTYGSPLVPGPQMGLLSFGATLTYFMDVQKRYFLARWYYGTRDYHTYSIEGARQPDIHLYDQYINVLYHSGTNPNHIWDAGPSVEFYHSLRPFGQNSDSYTEFLSRKMRLEYKGVIYKHLGLNLKAGFADDRVKDIREITERKFDVHLMAGYNFKRGVGVSLGYDYGPIVNTGLYQYAGDSKNHSLNLTPSLASSYFNGRINLNLFSSLIYRMDMNHFAFNFNPKVEAYIYKDWYFVVGGTYHYSYQNKADYQSSRSHVYGEFAIMKKWGKSEFNKWQKDTRRLKLVLFRDDNGNGVKEYGEKGVPYVKTRLVLTNSATENISTEFPVDIVLLTDEEGVAIFNRLPMGFYDLTIIPLEDVGEYFYVDKGAEKLEIINSTVYYVPFRKATKLTGGITVSRQKFVKKGQEALDLSNIRITAYNNYGNSYSSFTHQDGSFTIYLPGDNMYYLRMPNVFGENFRITNNDMQVYISDTSSNHAIFSVTESTRQIALKKTQPAKADTARPKPLKIKVLHGQIYENPAFDTVDVHAPPDFNIRYAPPPEQLMSTGNYYVIVWDLMERTDARRYQRILGENGVNSYLGLEVLSGLYYVFTNYYTTEKEARAEMDRLKKSGMKDVRVLKY